MRLTRPASTTSAERDGAEHDGERGAGHEQADDRGHGHDGEAAEVERQHRAPRRVPLEDHLLARVQVHGGERYHLRSRPPPELVFAPWTAPWLASQLAAGRSIESIARELGRDPSTVAYWVNKHGLVSAHAPRHAPRGPIPRETLVALVEQGLSRPRDGGARSA